MTVWFAPTQESLLQEWAEPTRLTRSQSLDLDFCYPYISTIMSSVSYAPEMLVSDIFKLYFTSYGESTVRFHALTGMSLPILQDVTRGKPDRISAREFVAHGYWGEAHDVLAYVASEQNWGVSTYIRKTAWYFVVDEWGRTA